MLKTVGKHAPPPPGALPPPRWGNEEALRELYGDRVTALRCTTHAVTERFLSPQHFADHFLTHYGPTYKASQRLDEDGKRAFRDDLVALCAGANRADDGAVVCDWEYLVAIATKV
jgi:hypothetical protein